VPKSKNTFNFNCIVENLAAKSLITKINTSIIMNRFTKNDIVFALDEMNGYEKVLIIKYEKILETDCGMIDKSELEYIKTIINDITSLIFQQIINETLNENTN